jgi:Golgi phosphoprotein 3
MLTHSAYAASVLENPLQRLSYDSREAAFQRCDDILAEFCVWPFGQTVSASAGPVTIGGGTTRKREGGSGSGRESVQELVREVRREMSSGPMAASGAAVQPGAGGKQEGEEDPCFEVVATVLEIFGRMDSLVSCTFGFDDVRLMQTAVIRSTGVIHLIIDLRRACTLIIMVRRKSHLLCWCNADG